MSDLISRQDAIDAMWKALYAYEDLTEKQFMEHEELELKDWFLHRIFVQKIHEECMKAVEALPSAEPKTGEWTKRQPIGDVSFAYCSECGEPILHGHTSPLWNYCPNCGARMRGEEE